MGTKICESLWPLMISSDVDVTPTPSKLPIPADCTWYLKLKVLLECSTSITSSSLPRGGHWSETTRQHKILRFTNKTSRTEDLTVYSFFLVYKRHPLIIFIFLHLVAITLKPSNCRAHPRENSVRVMVNNKLVIGYCSFYKTTL